MRNNKLLLALTLSLTACSPNDKSAKPQNEFTNKYLACYALEPIAKSQCTQSLQFESEKLGFKQFLNKLNLPCESIEEGPEFIPEKHAYLVKCKPHYHYLMQFNYESKEWKLITEAKTT